MITVTWPIQENSWSTGKEPIDDIREKRSYNNPSRFNFSSPHYHKCSRNTYDETDTIMMIINGNPGIWRVVNRWRQTVSKFDRCFRFSLIFYFCHESVVVNNGQWTNSGTSDMTMWNITNCCWQFLKISTKAEIL